MSIALASFLKDFSEPDTASPSLSGRFDIGGFNDLNDGFPADLAPETVDPEAIRREAYAQGHEAATQELQQSHEAAMEALRAEHAAELEAVRISHEEMVAPMIVQGLQQMADAVARRVGDQAADALAPVLSDMIVEKAVASMAAMVRRAILDGEVATVTVTGPEHLYQLLKTGLGEDAALLRHVDASDLDLSADVDGTILVTRMSAWADSLKKVME